MSRSVQLVRFACLLGFCAASQSAAAADFVPWSQYQADAAHTGHIPITVNPASIQPLWSTDTYSLSPLGPFVASIHPGAVTDANHIYITGTGAFQFVFALDRHTGASDWSTMTLRDDPLSLPAVANGKVYVHQYGESSTPNESPQLLAFDAATGAQVIANPHVGEWGCGSRPAVVGDQVFVAGGGNGGVDAFDASSGAHQWFVPLYSQFGWVPTADDQRVYVYMASAYASPGPEIGRFFAFNRSDGSYYSIVNSADSSSLGGFEDSVYDTVTLGSQNDAIVPTSGDTYSPGGHPIALTSFDLVNHSIRWQSYAGFDGPIAVDDGTIFATVRGKISLFDEATGALLNSWTAPDNKAIAGDLAVTDNLIFAHTYETTYAIDRATLATVWSTNITGDLTIDSDLLLISGSSSITAFALPEPSSLSLLACATLPLLRRRRR